MPVKQFCGLLLAASIATASAAGMFGASSAWAGDSDGKAHVPSADAGRALAEKLCVTCHLTGGESANAQVGPPPFKSIANKPGQTFEHIKSVLIQPHAPMPDMQLTNDEILDLTAFIDSLKAPGAEPLLPPPDEKMVRPKQG